MRKTLFLILFAVLVSGCEDNIPENYNVLAFSSTGVVIYQNIDDENQYLKTLNGKIIGGYVIPPKLTPYWILNDFEEWEEDGMGPHLICKEKDVEPPQPVNCPFYKDKKD